MARSAAFVLSGLVGSSAAPKALLRGSNREVSEESDCPICGTVFCALTSGGGDKYIFECATCGTFAVTGSALPALKNAEQLTAVKRAAISHQLRVATDQGQQPLLSTYELDSLIENARLPSPAVQAMNFIRLVGESVLSTGLPMKDVPTDVEALIGSPNRSFAMRIVKELFDRRLLNGIQCGTLDSPHDMVEVDLTLAGWEQYEAEKQGKLAGKYGFIALKFGDTVLDQFLQNVIKPSITSIGFTLEDMRDAARAGVIDNVMRARIRDAAFVLVDLTHANPGAYWEAGYAEGLGKPVLYLCNKAVFEEQGTHFDTNHCTTVLWDCERPEHFTADLLATLRRSLGLFAS